MSSIRFLFTIYLGVKSHMECIKLLFQLSHLISFNVLFISKKEKRIIVFNDY